MTTDKDTKKLIHAHAARTRKRYTAARRELLTPKGPWEKYEGLLTKANAEFLRPLKGLDVHDVRFTEDRSGQRSGILLFIEPDRPKGEVAAIARRAKDTWGGGGVLVSIMERGESGGPEVWGSDWSQKFALDGGSLAKLWKLPPEVVAGL